MFFMLASKPSMCCFNIIVGSLPSYFVGGTHILAISTPGVGYMKLYLGVIGEFQKLIVALARKRNKFLIPIT